MPTKPQTLKEIITMFETFDDVEQALINLHLSERDERVKALRLQQRQSYRVALHQLLGYMGMTQEVITDAYTALERVDRELDTLTRHISRVLKEDSNLKHVAAAEPGELRKFIDPLLLDMMRGRSYDTRSSDAVASTIMGEVTKVFSEPNKLYTVLNLVHNNDRSVATAVRQIRAGYVHEIRSASLLEATARHILVTYRKGDTGWQKHWREFAKSLTRYIIPDTEIESA